MNLSHRSIALSLVLFGLASCATVGPGGQTGGFSPLTILNGGGGSAAIFTSVGAGGTPIYVEGTPLVLDGLSRGESTEVCILGLFSFGDSSIDEAAKVGKLRDVRYVDRKVFNFLGIYAKYTTVALGESTTK